MDLTTISTIIGSTASLLSAILMYYFTQHFPWETSRKNVMRILLEQSPEFKKIIDNLKKNAQLKLGSEHLQRGVLGGMLIPIVITTSYVLIYWNELFPEKNSSTSNILISILLLWAFIIWELMLLVTYFVYTFRDNLLYPASRMYIGSSLVFIGSLGIITLTSKSFGQFFAIYIMILITISILKLGISKKEDKLVGEEWSRLPDERKNIMLRVYTQDGHEFIGVLQNVFDNTWLQLKRIDSKSTVNIEWRTIKGVEVISD